MAVALITFKFEIISLLWETNVCIKKSFKQNIIFYLQLAYREFVFVKK